MMPNNRREPLASLSLNKQNERMIHPSYQPLSPPIDPIARTLLPWKNSEITGVRVFELFWDSEVVNGVSGEHKCLCKGEGRGRWLFGEANCYWWRVRKSYCQSALSPVPTMKEGYHT